jgi:hypothetical protein
LFAAAAQVPSRPRPVLPRRTLRRCGP